jgi:hypothetical protein
VACVKLLSQHLPGGSESHAHPRNVPRNNQRHRIRELFILARRSVAKTDFVIRAVMWFMNCGGLDMQFRYGEARSTSIYRNLHQSLVFPSRGNKLWVVFCEYPIPPPPVFWVCTHIGRWVAVAPRDTYLQDVRLCWHPNSSQAPRLPLQCVFCLYVMPNIIILLHVYPLLGNS